MLLLRFLPENWIKVKEKQKSFCQVNATGTEFILIMGPSCLLSVVFCTPVDPVLRHPWRYRGVNVCQNNHNHRSNYQIQSDSNHHGWLKLTCCDTIFLSSFPPHLLTLSLCCPHPREFLLKSSMNLCWHRCRLFLFSDMNWRKRVDRIIDTRFLVVRSPDSKYAS